MQKLTQKIPKQAHCNDTVTLEYHERIKSRLRVTLNSGEESSIVLSRGSNLRDGDVLQSESGFTVKVEAAKEIVSTIITGDTHLLARICYHLGNRHVPLQIDKNRVRYLHDHVLDEMIRSLGLDVLVEQARFEPESGAYHNGHSHNRSHDHHHEH